MSDVFPTPIPYRLAYSEHVREELKKLAARARERGLTQVFRNALIELDRRLQIYPQFGQPLRDLKLKPAQLWVGVVPPLVVHYVLDEERRHVMVGVPIQPMKNSGL